MGRVAEFFVFVYNLCKGRGCNVKNMSMNRFLLSLLAVLLVIGNALADGKSITVGQLPVAAQAFLKEYFSDVEVLLVKQGDDFLHKDYEVALKNGARIYFDGKGNWNEVEVARGMVPLMIVPAAIVDYVGRNYAGEHIMGIDRDRQTTEIKLSNGVELKFDKRCRLIDIDN